MFHSNTRGSASRKRVAARASTVSPDEARRSTITGESGSCGCRSMSSVIVSGGMIGARAIRRCTRRHCLPAVRCARPKRGARGSARASSFVQKTGGDRNERGHVCACQTGESGSLLMQQEVGHVAHRFAALANAKKHDNAERAEIRRAFPKSLCDLSAFCVERRVFQQAVRANSMTREDVRTEEVGGPTGRRWSGTSSMQGPTEVGPCGQGR